MSRIITLEKIQKLAADFAQKGGVVVAPTEAENGRAYYQTLSGGEIEQLALSGRNKPADSVKKYFFPRHEVLYSFVRRGNDVELTSAPEFSTPQLILGCRPCEAASLPILDPVFAWDYQDRFYQARREQSVVVSIACSESDADCFCSSVGGSPENTDGADAILYELADGTFEVRTVTDKGAALFEGQTSEGKEIGKACDAPQKRFDADKLRVWLDAHFDDPFWAQETRSCVGCGACTAVCPTCHCFDIVDEGSFRQGTRVKNWDFCQSALFTLHASGHNPRADQAARQRQRITHKFSIYPEKFGRVLCTGCGNCSRYCAAALGVLSLLERLEKVKDA